MTEPIPNVIAITLSKHCAFMYEHFVIATQDEIFLLLEKHGDAITVLRFDSPQMKYGSPNDETRGGHPLLKYGLGFYGFFEIENSPWIKEQMVANRVHHRHSDALFDGMKHYVACFKDVMLEVTCRAFEEKQMSLPELTTLINEQLDFLATK